MGQTQRVLLSQDTVITNLTGNTCKLLLKLEMAEKMGKSFLWKKEIELLKLLHSERFKRIHLDKILCIVFIEIMT